MIRIYKKFKDLLDVTGDWTDSAGKFWRTKADGSGLEAVDNESSTIVTATAGQPLSGHRVVASDGAGVAIYADPSLTLNRVIGITMGAAAESEQVSIKTEGVLTEPTWSFDPSQGVFLGINGELSQATPSSGMILPVGRVIDPQTLYVSIGTPIII